MNEIKNWYLSKSIKFKIISAYVLSLIIIGLVGYSYYVYENLRQINREVNLYRERLIETNKSAVRSIVNVALAGIERYYDDYKKGEITEGDAKIKAIEFVHSIRYNMSSYNYAWINTIDGIMVLDPPKPLLNGKNVWDLRDKNGVYLFREMARVVKSQGGGFVHYCWAKLGENDNKCYPKISYVGYFYPWKWVVGSGFYLDEIDKAVEAYAHRKYHDIVFTIANSLALGGFISIIAALIFYFLVSYVTGYLKTIGELSEKLAREEISPSLKLPYPSKDELGALVEHFNRFIDESYKLMIFKKTIEEDIDVHAVYKRLFDLIKDDFGIKEFNVFEVDNSKHALRQVSVYDDEKLMCKQEILINCMLCRAVRTAKDVDSFV